MTIYLIGQPLAEGQNPMRVYHKPHFQTGKMIKVIEVFRKDGAGCVGVSIAETPELGDSERLNYVIIPALAALNDHIARKGFDSGPFTLDDYRSAA